MKRPTPAQRAVLDAAAATADGILPDQAMPKRTEVIDRLVEAGLLRGGARRVLVRAVANHRRRPGRDRPGVVAGRHPVSVRVMTWVWDFSPVGGTERLVLLAVADNAADDGTNAWPSLATLARKTRVDVRTVRRIIRRLEDSGHLLVEVAAGPGGANRYTVVMNGSDRAVDQPVHGPVDNPPATPGNSPRGRFARGVQRPGTPDTATSGTPGHSSAPRTSRTSMNRPGAPAPSRAGGAALPPPVEAARCPKHPGQSATHCGPCRAETLGGTR